MSNALRTPRLTTTPQPFTTDATLEAFIVLLAQNPRGKEADRQRFYPFGTVPPSSSIGNVRKKPIVLDNPFVCVVDCLPPEVLPELSDEHRREDGFI